jgi:hypothetical protein
MISSARSKRTTAFVLSGLMCLASSVHAQSVPQPLSAVRTGLASPHVLRDAAARQHGPLRAAQRSSGQKNGMATKVTAGVAMGVVGFFVGATVAYMTAYAMRSGGNKTLMAGGVAGAAGGGALGVWLASR